MPKKSVDHEPASVQQAFESVGEDIGRLAEQGVSGAVNAIASETVSAYNRVKKRIGKHIENYKRRGELKDLRKISDLPRHRAQPARLAEDIKEAEDLFEVSKQPHRPSGPPPPPPPGPPNMPSIGRRVPKKRSKKSKAPVRGSNGLPNQNPRMRSINAWEPMRVGHQVRHLPNGDVVIDSTVMAGEITTTSGANLAYSQIFYPTNTTLFPTGTPVNINSLNHNKCKLQHAEMIYISEVPPTQSGMGIMFGMMDAADTVPTSLANCTQIQPAKSFNLGDPVRQHLVIPLKYFEQLEIPLKYDGNTEAGKRMSSWGTLNIFTNNGSANAIGLLYLKVRMLFIGTVLSNSAVFRVNFSPKSAACPYGAQYGQVGFFNLLWIPFNSASGTQDVNGSIPSHGIKILGGTAGLSLRPGYTGLPYGVDVVYFADLENLHTLSVEGILTNSVSTYTGRFVLMASGDGRTWTNIKDLSASTSYTADSSSFTFHVGTSFLCSEYGTFQQYQYYSIAFAISSYTTGTCTFTMYSETAIGEVSGFDETMSSAAYVPMLQRWAASLSTATSDVVPPTVHTHINRFDLVRAIDRRDFRFLSRVVQDYPDEFRLFSQGLEDQLKDLFDSQVPSTVEMTRLDRPKTLAENGASSSAVPQGWMMLKKGSATQ